MRLFTILIVLLSLSFTACTSKNKVRINDKINSISLNKNIIISKVPKTIKGSITIGFGLGGQVSRHVGFSMGTSVTPDVENTEALVLEKAININNISLSDLIFKEFDSQMKNDTFYKNKYVPFGSNYEIHLFVHKYYLDDDIFSSKANIKIEITAKILNNQNKILYETRQKNTSLSSLYQSNKILNSKEILIKSLNISIKDVLAKIIDDMKKN